MKRSITRRWLIGAVVCLASLLVVHAQQPTVTEQQAKERIAQAKALLVELEGKLTPRGTAALWRILDGLENLSIQVVPDATPPPVEVCGDGIDNDKDGQIDEGCAPPPTEVCGNGIDDDKDGQIDEGCPPLPPPPTEICGDGIDNDKDGQIDEGCSPPPPPADGDNVWQFVTPVYSGAPDGGKIFPQQWQVPTGGIYDPVSKRTCITERWHDAVRINSIYANSFICYDPTTNSAEVVAITNWRVVSCSKEPGVCIGTLVDDPASSDPAQKLRVFASYETHPMAPYDRQAIQDEQAKPESPRKIHPINWPDGKATPVDGHPLAGGIAFDPVERAIYRINGANNSSSYFYGDAHPKETWKLPLATGVWEKVADSRRGDVHPPSDANDVDDYGCAFYDPPTKTLGYFQITSAGTVTWAFDPVTKVWTEKPLDASAQGVHVAIAGCAYDAKRSRVLVLGGGRNLYNPVRTDASLQKFRAYSMSTNTWTDLAPPPVPMYAPEVAYSTVADVALAVATVQQADKTGLSTTYVYTSATNTWGVLPGTFNRGPINFGHSGTVTYNPEQNVFVFHGGTWNAPKWATLRYRSGTEEEPPPPPDDEPPPDEDPPPPDPPEDPPPPPPPLEPGVGIGKGCTTVWYHDQDCDGYGTGVRSSGSYGDEGLGDKPDADDADPKVNTPATVLSVYDANTNGVLDATELKLFLAERKGLKAVGAVYYVSPTGDNATGAPNDPTKPYRTYNFPLTGSTVYGVRRLLKPGDAVIYLAGSYDEPRIGNTTPPFVSGEPGRPSIVMAAPGERVILNSASAIGTQLSHDIHIEGFAIDSPFNIGFGSGLNFSLTRQAVFRHLEIQRVNWVTAMQDLHDITFEQNLIHHNREHGLYLGTRELSADHVTVRSNILYRNGVNALYGGLQLNGRFDESLVDGNIIHSNGQWCITFAMGVTNTRVQNNLCFNNQGHGIILQMYPGHGFEACNPGTDGAVTGTICPYEQTGNLITNNTIWIGRFNQAGVVPSSGSPSFAAAFRIGRNNIGTVGDGLNSQGQNTVQNNIIVTDNGPMVYADAEWVDTWTFRNNIVYRVGGDSKLVSYGGKLFTFSEFETAFPLATGNRFADPQFVTVDVGFFATPQQFNFRLGATSPAIGFGTATLAPTTDVQGAARTMPPDAGAYRK